jgi:hypothetical protein
MRLEEAFDIVFDLAEQGVLEDDQVDCAQLAREQKRQRKAIEMASEYVVNDTLNVTDDALNKYREKLKAAEYDLKCTQRERGYNLARAQAAEAMLREVLDFLEHAPISYANGVTHNGIDEGDVRGGEMHDALVERIKKVLKHPAIVGEL